MQWGGRRDITICPIEAVKSRRNMTPWTVQAQVMAAEAVPRWLGGVRRGKGEQLPVMFFGTLEVGWIPTASVLTWQAGLDRKLANRKQKLLSFSYRQVPKFLHILMIIKDLLSPPHRP